MTILFPDLQHHSYFYCSLRIFHPTKAITGLATLILVILSNKDVACNYVLLIVYYRNIYLISTFHRTESTDSIIGSIWRNNHETANFMTNKQNTSIMFSWSFKVCKLYARTINNTWMYDCQFMYHSEFESDKT